MTLLAHQRTDSAGQTSPLKSVETIGSRQAQPSFVPGAGAQQVHNPCSWDRLWMEPSALLLVAS